MHATKPDHTDTITMAEQSSPVKQQKQNRYNKKQTIENIKATAKSILIEEGLQGLRINKVARESQHSKGVIYDYFGSLQQLTKDVIIENDPWLHYAGQLEQIYATLSQDKGKTIATTLLKEHFAHYMENRFFQQISIMELTTEDTALKELFVQREELASKLFAITDDYFQDSDVNIRMICSLLIAGINYMVLHRKNNDSAFCGMDIELEEDRKVLDRSIEQIISWAFAKLDEPTK